jgi:hypothetical protein
MPSFLSEDDIEREIIRVMKDRWEKDFRADRRIGTLARLSVNSMCMICALIFQSLNVVARRIDYALGQECPSYARVASYGVVFVEA